MPRLDVPPEVHAVFREFFTCDFTTVNKAGQPLTWPLVAYYHESAGEFVLTSSIAFPTKAQNAQRNPKVSLLFADPTGTSLEDAPAVLVQGDARVEELQGYPSWSIDLLKTSMRRQPDSMKYLANPLARALFLFYYQRLSIIVQPRRILTWPRRDFNTSPVEIEVLYVES